LNETCAFKSENPYEEEGVDIFDTEKLRLLGILWCDGKTKEKSFELYDVL
jgi:hypothetical protein